MDNCIEENYTPLKQDIFFIIKLSDKKV